MTDCNVASEARSIRPPFGGDGFVTACSVLVGESAKDRVQRVELLTLGFARNDQAMRHRPGRELAFQLS